MDVDEPIGGGPITQMMSRIRARRSGQAARLGWLRAIRFPIRRRIPVRALSTVLVGAAAWMALQLSGTIGGTTDALVAMGFDPDRARLIAALLSGGIAGAAAGLATGHRPASGVVAFGGFAALYAPTFMDETQAAFAAHGTLGVFDPVGWAFTVATLAMAGLVVAWAVATLAADARRNLISAGAVLLEAGRRRSARDLPIWKPAIAFLVVALLASTAPAFGDMVNFTPDFMMRHGGPAPVPLVAGSDQAGGGTGGSSAISPSPLPSSLVPEAGTGALGTVGAVSGARPWLIHAPLGNGKIEQFGLPAPWVGGRSSTASVWVYLPPGYSTASLHYPTIYEIPWALTYWNNGSNIITQLDAMITSGQIPPTIVVFVSDVGGPYVDSECADSADGREHFDSYVANTVVPNVDAHVRTTREAAARTLLGYSQGGYCAATLLLHHPDVFANAIAMSGYYTAAPNDPQTVNAWRPFGNDPSLLRADSPLQIESTLPAAVRHHLFFILTGSPAERFYGPNFTEFASQLTRDGYEVVVLPTSLGHAWKGVRSMLPTVLSELAGHQLQAGVFRGIYA